MKFYKNYLIIGLLSVFASSQVMAQRVELIKMGDMEHWQERIVEESGIIGGNDKSLYEITSTVTSKPNVPFVNTTSDWGTSSVYARVSGVTKGSSTVFPESRETGGTAARLETKLEKVKVLGIINISVVATGSIFLGKITEPIKDTKNPQAKLMQGIPFTERPSFLQFDYKFMNANGGKRIYDSGFSSDELPGKNAAEACLILQKRWEDAEGNVFAKRIGTAWRQYPNDASEWVNGEKVEVLYGDITHNSNFKAYMGLLKSEPLYTKNSKGEVVPIQEIGWADADETPTHLILRMSSGYGGAYIGTPGAKFWVDNIALGYND